MYVWMCGCWCVVVPFILDVRLVDAPDGVTQEECHTGVFCFVSFVLFVFFLRYRQVRYGSWSCFHFCAVNLSRCFLCLYTSFLYLFHLFVVSVSSSCVFILLCVSFVATVLVFLPGMYRSVPLLIELPCLGSLQTRMIFLPYA